MTPLETLMTLRNAQKVIEVKNLGKKDVKTLNYSEKVSK